MKTSKEKIDLTLLVIGLILLTIVGITNQGRILYIGYALIVGLYFFPINLFLKKEPITTPQLASNFMLSNCIALGYILSITKDSFMILNIVSIVLLVANILILLYFVNKNNLRYRLHIIGIAVLANSALFL